MQAVALAARQHAALLLLIGAREIEPGHVSAGIDLAVAQHNQVGTLRNHLVNGFFRVDGLVLLIHVGQFDRLTDSESSRSRLFESHDHPEEGSLARTVGADHTDDTGRRSPKAFDTSCASITTSPRRGPFGMNISSFSSFCLVSSFISLS